MVRLRQVALVARDLEAVVADLCDVLGVRVAYRDPAVRVFGLRNAVMPVGDTFLEVVSPVEPDTTAGRFLARRGGDAGYMAIFQVDDLAAAEARVGRAGVRVVWRADLPEARTIHLHPRDVGGAIVSLDVMDPPDSWAWAGPTWREHVDTARVTGVTGVEVEAADPGNTAARWAAVLGVQAVPDNGRWRVGVSGGEVRFVPATSGHGDGIVAVDLAGVDAAPLETAARARGLPVGAGAVRIGGVWFRLVGKGPA